MTETRLPIDAPMAVAVGQASESGGYASQISDSKMLE